jgi:hypothetical protein
MSLPAEAEIALLFTVSEVAFWLAEPGVPRALSEFNRLYLPQPLCLYGLVLTQTQEHICFIPIHA